MERDVDLILGGKGRAVDDRKTFGEVSDLDAMRHKDLRDKAIDKKVKDAL